MDKKLEVKDLQISFRTQGGILKAVRNISFDLNKGETLAIVGESGSGKSVTSKAIMGILAGNSIVEGGEILYDGQDLLKISEEDYHKLRGDKIAMIFQDPMSSLNPIMRVGQQLTEAMILKARTGKKNARRAINTKLKLLRKNINAANKLEGLNESKQVKERLEKFNAFSVDASKFEGVYNEAYAHGTQLESALQNAILMLEKQKKLDVVASLRGFVRQFNRATHPDFLPADEKFNACMGKMQALIAQGKNVDNEAALAALKEGKSLISAALAQEKPDFFSRYMDGAFMQELIAMAKSGVVYAHNQSIEAKRVCLSELKEALEYFKGEKLAEGQSRAYLKSLSAKVNKAVDRLSVKKESVEYVFPTALGKAIDDYFEGIKRNPIEEKKYLKNKKQYDAIIAKGKQPDWVLQDQVVVDLEQKQKNICKVIENLINHYEACIAETSFDADAAVLDIFNFLKEQASKMVVKMNKWIAREKAIKLLEEVGIPEPATRFKQYPFEFSGGMRQRIVIAIALSANPDILICDEPTTALDVTIQAQILELINKIKKERNLSVIFITHNMGVVANMADKIAVMYAGKIVEMGTAEEVFYEPAHPYTWALLSSMPDLHTTERLEYIPGTPPDMLYPPKGDAFAPRNKYALEIDFEVEPPLFDITETHSAATWLLHPNAPKVEMPELIKARIERSKKEREQ